MKDNCCIKNNCIQCCLDTMMILSSDDIKKIENLGFKKDFFVVQKEGWLMLKNHNGRCVFHDGIKCTIYENRPIGCKFYPVIFDKDESCAVFDKDCPYSNCFKISSSIINELYAVVKKVENERSKRK
jgi:Fe-S-cluster containining protein